MMIMVMEISTTTFPLLSASYLFCKRRGGFYQLAVAVHYSIVIECPNWGTIVLINEWQ